MEWRKGKPDRELLALVRVETRDAGRFLTGRWYEVASWEEETQWWLGITDPSGTARVTHWCEITDPPRKRRKP